MTLSAIEGRHGPILSKFLTVALAAALALGMVGFLPTVAAQADEGDAPSFTTPAANYHVASGYTGIAVDVRVSGFTDAEQIIVQVNRKDASPVIKSSKPATVAKINTGAAVSVTVPIVIQKGTYDEAGSSSWFMPEAVWAAETVPTEVKITITRTDGEPVETTVPIGGSIDGVMPAQAEFTNPAAAYVTGTRYSGLNVDIRVTGFTDAEQITLRVDRENGAPVTKVSKPGASMFADINKGKAISITAPIVIQPGTYDEADSSSWLKPGAVWTSKTIPTSVTVTIKRTFGPDVVTTLALEAPPAGVMPDASAPVNVEVPANQPADQPFVVTVPEGVENATLDLGATPGGVATVPSDVVVNTSVGASLFIPAGTVATASFPDWDGVISLPTVKDGVVVPTTNGDTATVALAIEVGIEGGQITFETPVKLVLEGQAGMKAGFIQGDTFTAIEAECAATNPADFTEGECWMNDGDDLVIWTTHFTTFVAYSVTAAVAGDVAPAVSGGAGGTLANTGASDLTPVLGAVGLLAMLGLGLITLARARRRGLLR